VRVCILALDGLDYFYARTNELHALLQREHSYVSHEGLPEKANSTQIWASFLTGLSPEQAGIPRADSPQREARIAEGVRTIFHLAEKPVALWLPSYNPHPEYWHPRAIGALRAALSGGDPERLAHFNLALDLFRRQQAVFKRRFTTFKWDLLVSHFNLVDAICHVSEVGTFQSNAAYEEVSALADWTARRIQRMGGILLIVSDHGFLGLMHSRYGFYSSNTPLPIPKPPTFLDFYPTIERLLRG